MCLSRVMLETCNGFILNHSSPLTSGSSFYPSLSANMPGVENDVDRFILIGYQLECFLMKLGNTAMLW